MLLLAFSVVFIFSKSNLFLATFGKIKFEPESSRELFSGCSRQEARTCFTAKAKNVLL